MRGLADNTVGDNVGVDRCPLAAFLPLGPAAKLGVAPGRPGLLRAGSAAKKCGSIDFDFEVAVRACNLHAQNLTHRWLCFTEFFKVAHYPKILDGKGRMSALEEALRLFPKEGAAETALKLRAKIGTGGFRRQ